MDGVRIEIAPHVQFYEEQRRHGNSLSIEDGGHDLATAPFYLLLVVGHALPGRQHVIHDNNFFSFDVPRDTIIPFEYAVLAAFGCRY